jgi:hypothetical protein
VDLLVLKLWGVIIDAKVKLINEAFQRYVNAHEIIGAKRKESVKNMEVFISKYNDELEIYKGKLKNDNKITVNGMLEDITLKGNRTYISYFIWLTLAIIFICFAIKRLKS